jgi:glucosamine--fructose-6-phosphate aminotransferase (isomerizing)
MCGIVAALADRNIVSILIEGLRRLEYRGYDSAGIAVVNGSMHRLRSVGRVASLAKLANDHALEGTVGIAHTRWATHGAPSERNAHPQASCEELAVVHNGIIENYEYLRERLASCGYQFTSDTDTEVIAHLIHSHYVKTADLFDATHAAVAELRGAYALAVLTEAEADKVVVARRGSPLLLGLADGELFAASDACALLQVTREFITLKDGDVAELSRNGYRIVDDQGRAAQRPVRFSQLSAAHTDLGSYQHYMQKEIFEQPAALAATVAAATGSYELGPQLFGPEAARLLAHIDAVTILACGTSYHAGLVARHWLESLAGIPVSVEVASEYRYRDSVPNQRALVVAISQSGETADTIAALQHASALGQHHTLTICNVAESSLVHQSQMTFLTQAGTEIGVASTKAFTTQLAALFLLTLVLAKLRGRLSAEVERQHVAALRDLPAAISRVMELEPAMRDWAQCFAAKQHALFLGRGIHYPIALEGALKLKEISYIHAEAYPAGELKHGPLALVDAQMPVVAVAPNDALLEKLKSNLQEVRARGGELYVLADSQSAVHDSPGMRVVRLPPNGGQLSPLLYAVPLQLLAYHAALVRGTDVDKPRNLAKSVTVE